MPWLRTTVRVEDGEVAEMFGAIEIMRGVARAFAEADQAVLTELPLANGRRADLVAIDRAGLISVVEVKSCRADYLTDHKWPEYLDYGDRFYFAVASDFPLDVLPKTEGLIVADRFAGEVVREAVIRRLTAARRKAMLLRFARISATRLQILLDPDDSQRLIGSGAGVR